MNILFVFSLFASIFFLFINKTQVGALSYEEHSEKSSSNTIQNVSGRKRKESNVNDSSTLKNPKIQSEYEILPEALKNETSSSISEVAPRDSSAPILGTQLNNGMTTMSPVILTTRDDTDESVVVTIEYEEERIPIKGFFASMGIWKPHVANRYEYSKSEIWLVAGDEYSAPSDVNIVGAGWHVDPSSGHNDTALLGFWTIDGGDKTGGYNHDVEGFHQVDAEIRLGRILIPSVYGGQQKFLNVHIYKNSVVAHGDNIQVWWLVVNDVKIGYWPAAIFTHLNEGFATRVKMSGMVKNLRVEHNGRHTETGMGSGHYAEEGFGKAALFSNLIITAANGTDITVHEDDLYLETIDNVNCYNVIPFTGDPLYGTGFHYGGPGFNESELEPRRCE